MFRKKDNEGQDDEAQDLEALKAEADAANKARVLAQIRVDAAEGQPTAILTLAMLEKDPTFIDRMFDENGEPNPSAALEAIANADPEVMQRLISEESGHDVPIEVIADMIAKVQDAGDDPERIERIRAEADRRRKSKATNLDEMIDKMVSGEEKPDREETLAMAEDSGFSQAWASFSEAMGADVKLIKTGPDDDDEEVQITLPPPAAYMLIVAIEAGIVAVNETHNLPFVKDEAKLDHVKKLHAHGDPRMFEQSLYAGSLISGRIAFKKAMKEYDESREDLDFDMADAIEAGADAKWRSAIDEGDCPVETPHDLTKYLKWIQGEKARLETELAEATAGGGKEQ